MVLYTFHSTLYPLSAISLTTVRNPPPPSIDSKFLTFSHTSHLGLFSLRSSINLIISKNNPLLVPSFMPFCLPAMLTSWQGNPKVHKSAFGKSFPLTFVTSPPNHKFVVSYITLYEACANLSNSHHPTHSMPACSNPLWNPPIPLKKSINFIYPL